MPNRLVNETSPYLLQHAHNPVDWYPWSDEALQKAKQENKPILVSIGYSACHWCHVMEKESFENEHTASIMNKHFVNIKIDREERPDLDHIYMDAVQAMTGSGGWPLNVFLTPGLKPFYGGTYFPPQPAFNRPSWKEILTAVSTAFHEKRNEIDEQAENLTGHLQQSNSFGLQNSNHQIFSEENLDECFQNLMKTADKEWGGFGSAPKFPQTFSIQFLLRYHYALARRESERSKVSPAKEDLKETALTQALLSLDKMIEGGIYDQAGGGFARYATDTEWLVPHFEKMLYDNALLISVLSEAYQLTRKEKYKEVIEETIGFVVRELMHPDGGFYAALDADSEGEEGKFYVWSFDEVKNLLRDDAAIFCDFFDITEKGNWEGKNILRVKKPIEEFAEVKSIPVGELRSVLKKGKEILLASRNKRTRPGLDDKILLSWNALMNVACSKAFAATGIEEFKQLATDNMRFLLDNFRNGSDRFYHSWKNGKAKQDAFLDDYAFLVQALIHMQEITGDIDYLLTAKCVTEHVIKNFSEEGTGFFFFTSLDQNDVILRKKEVYDGATPSGNSIMLYNLHHLSILFDQHEWKHRAGKAVLSLGNPIINYPTSFAVWGCLLQEIIDGTQEIAVVGEKSSLLIAPILAEFIPHKVFMAPSKITGSLPLIKGKSYSNPALIYLCKQYACKQPVESLDELLKLLKYQE
jgi:uncharacterized protein YyaL (SSP411 family)